MFNHSESTDFLGRLTQELQTFTGCARLLVTLCTVSVLTAVFFNFLLARHAHAMRTKKKSTVETGSMLAFFVGFYLLIRFRVGVHEIPGLYYPAAILGLVLLLLGTTINILGRFALGRNWGNHVIIYAFAPSATANSSGVIGCR